MKFKLIAFLVCICNACTAVRKEEPPKYTIEKRHFVPEKLSETSGLIKYKGLIWTFNDSGGKPEIYGFNLKNDSVEQAITLKNATNVDWEDISQDEKYIYIGDFGNNQGTRDSLIVYRIPKSSIPQKGNAAIVAEKIVFSYPGYKAVTMPVSFSQYDCEAIVVLKDSIFLFTKDWINGTSTIYGLPKNPGKYMAKKIKTLDVQGLITGASYQNNTFTLIGYNSFIPFIIQYFSNDIKGISDTNSSRVIFDDLATYQTEGICLDGQDILISSEKTRSPAQIMHIKLKL